MRDILCVASGGDLDARRDRPEALASRIGDRARHTATACCITRVRRTATNWKPLSRQNIQMPASEPRAGEGSMEPLSFAPPRCIISVEC